MKISTEAKIGIFVVVTLALLIWGVNFLKGKNVFKNTERYYSVLDNIEGLVKSGAIYLNGYKIGTVADIIFDTESKNITVEYRLEEKIKIPKNSVFQIYSSSLVSDIKVVRLLLSNEDEYYSPGDTVPGTTDKGLTGMIDPIKQQVVTTVAKLDSILSSVNKLLGPETINDLKSTLSNFDNISASLDKDFSEGGSVDNTLDNLAAFSQQLKNSSDELGTILANFQQLSDSLADSELKSAINNVNASMANANEILSKINQGEGSVGQLINNDSLYLSLESVSKDLDLLLIDLREHPKRYVHFSLFGKKEKE